MEYYFPQPNLTQITDIPGYANYYASGLLMPMLLLAWFVVLFSWFSRYNRFTALAGSIGVTLLTALPLTFITFNEEPLLPPNLVTILVVLLGVVGLFLYKQEHE